MKSFFCVLWGLMFSLCAHAGGKRPLPAPIEGFYGPEFTFTLDGTVPSFAKYQFIERLREHLIKNQPKAAKFTEISDGTDPVFYSPNGWQFTVGDDRGVVEITMKPLTVAQIRHFKSDIQDAIFVTAANSELFPWDYLGGGHLNFDTGIFDGDLLLARNFIVDFWNHSELSMGILNYDTNNALPLALYDARALENIRDVIARADAGEFGQGYQAIVKFFRAIDSILVVGNNEFHAGSRHKHHDLNFFHEGRVEIRSVRPQKNMDVWLAQTELIENRINKFLRPLTKPIPLKFKTPPKLPPDVLVPPVDPQRALKNFYQYVKQSGLDWKDHRVYIWPPWKHELKKFECEMNLLP